MRRSGAGTRMDTAVMDPDALAEQVRSAYDMIAEDYASRFSGTQPENAIELAMIDYFVAQLVGESKEVLDAGCGTGRMSRHLSDRGCHVQGIDLSPGMISMAHRDHPDIATQVGTMTDLPFPAARFDGILYWYSVIHVADSELAAVVDGARRVLRPAGLVLLAFQVGQGARDVGAAYRKRGYDISVTRFDRTVDQVATLFSAAGLREQARLVRRPLGGESTDQAFVLLRAA